MTRSSRDATVDRIEVQPVSPRVKSELVVTGARGTHDRSDFLLVRITTSAGVVGIGEISATLNWSGENSRTAAIVIRDALGPAIMGRMLAPVAELEAAMDQALHGHPFTKAGLSIALWDAWAKTLDLPLVTCLGGPRRRGVAIKCSLSGSGARLTAGHSAAMAAGFRRFKLKVGLDLESDVERVRQARALVGAETFLGIDANGGYDAMEAAALIERVASSRPAFLEQPTAPADLAALRELRGRGLPIVADESVFGMDSLVALLRARAADVVSIYVGKSGGPGRAVAMADTASAFGVDVLIGSNGELGIGAAAQLHVACAAQNLSARFPSDIIGGLYYEEDVIARPLELTGVRAVLPDGPGLGVELREELEESFEVIDA